MRCFTTPEFSKKIKSQSPNTVSLLTTLIKLIEKHDKESLLKGGIGGNLPYILPGKVYVFRFGMQDFRIYATFGNDSEGDYILISDFTFHSDESSPSIEPSYKNPRTNSAINPRTNSAINPRTNPAINPRTNSAINPHKNSAINPRKNSAINPRKNLDYGGPFVYSIELEPKGFIVRADDKVELIFNLNSDFQALCVQANNEVFVLFDENNEWIGFLVKADADVRLRFDLDNKWTGIIV